MNINEKLSKIQVEFKSKKSRFNSFGKYNFRSAEDILEGLKPLITKYAVNFTICETYSDGVITSTATVTDNEGGNFISKCAVVGVDMDQKGMQMPQKFGSASSYGKKYALGNLLLIDDTADADATNKHDKKVKTVAITDEQLVQAKAFVNSGGSITAIEKKYTLTTAQKAQLNA